MPKKQGDINRTVQLQAGEREAIEKAAKSKGLDDLSFSNLARLAIGKYLGVKLPALTRTTTFKKK